MNRNWLRYGLTLLLACSHAATIGGVIRPTASFYIVIESLVAGSFAEPYSGGDVEVRAFNAATDVEITKTITWSVEYTSKAGCTGILDPPVIKKPSFLSSDPVVVTISKSPGIDPGIYEYRLKAVNPADGSQVFSDFYTITVKPLVNTAPVLNISRNIDTTLAAGQTAIPYLEITGTVTDVCTDVITDFGWTQVDGPPLQNYDAGNGKLALQNAPAGTYVFRLSAKDAGGLSAERIVNIYVRQVDVPLFETMKAFSPNEDGIDDQWRIKNISVNGNLYSVMIVNQHGKMVFKSRPPYIDDVVWDGTNYGNPFPDGAYYFAITNQEGKEVKKGSVLLIR